MFPLLRGAVVAYKKGQLKQAYFLKSYKFFVCIPPYPKMKPLDPIPFLPGLETRCLDMLAIVLQINVPEDLSAFLF